MIAAITKNNGIPKPRPRPRFVLVAEAESELADVEDGGTDEEDVIELVDGVEGELDDDAEVKVLAPLVVDLLPDIEDRGLFADDVGLPDTVELAPDSAAEEAPDEPEEEELDWWDMEN